MMMTDFNNAWLLTLPELKQDGRYLPERTVFAQKL
jgi:nitrogen fixation protein